MPSRNAVRDIHVVVDLGGEFHPVAMAVDIARQMEAHLTGVSFAFQPIIPVYTMAAPVPTDFIVSAHEHAVADARASSERFEEMARAADVTFEARTIESMPGDGFAAAMRAFQLTDLVVVGQQDPDRLEPMREGLIEALLFQAGAPLVLVPHGGVRSFEPGRVVIAWDGGTTAARAVRVALPLLAKAESVLVLTVTEERKRSGVPGADLARYLARHGLEVELHNVDPTGRDISGAVLEFTAAHEVDWLVMGAFGHSRVREFFLGGTTRGMLSAATLPVFMAH